MNKSYKTKFGNIRIQEEKILISDNSKIQFFTVKASLLVNLAAGVMFLYSRGIDGSIYSFLWILQYFFIAVVFLVLM